MTTALVEKEPAGCPEWTSLGPGTVMSGYVGGFESAGNSCGVVVTGFLRCADAATADVSVSGS